MDAVIHFRAKAWQNSIMRNRTVTEKHMSGCLGVRIIDNEERRKQMICVVRHGETEWNAINIVLGRTDIPLNAKGLEQAQELARKIKDLKVDIFLCSPLSRARQTADAISRETGMEYTIDERLIEQNFGKFEGTDRFNPEYQAAKREYFARYPGGESYFDMAARVFPLIKELEGKDALLVTHGGIGRIIRSYFQDMGNEEFVLFAQGNCEIIGY